MRDQASCLVTHSTKSQMMPAMKKATTVAIRTGIIVRFSLLGFMRGAWGVGHVCNENRLTIKNNRIRYRTAESLHIAVSPV